LFLMNNDLVILWTQGYDMTNQGGSKAGKVQAMDSKNLLNEPGQKGCPAAIYPCTWKVWQLLSQYKLPARFNVSFGVKMKAGGVPSTFITSVAPCTSGKNIPQIDHSSSIQAEDDLDEISADIESELASVGTSEDQNNGENSNGY